MQCHLFLAWDICWLLEATQRLLAGGNYYHDFVEINPPLILFIYTIPVLIAKALHLNLVWIFRSYIAVIGVCSLFLSWRLLKKLCDGRRTWINILGLMLLALVYFIFPVSEFGQREHLTVMLTVPFALLVTLRLSSNKTLSILWPGIIGIMAGIGYAIKPYFLLAWVAIEIYYLWQKRILWSCLRIESILAGCVIVIYLWAIWFFTPDYLTKILPMVDALYTNYQLSPWFVLLFNPIAIVPIATILLVIGLRKENLPKHLLMILCLSCLGFFIAYFIQAKVWYYHMIPMVSYAMLIMVTIAPAFLQHFQRPGQFAMKIIPIFLFCIGVMLPMWMIYSRAQLYMPLYTNDLNTTNRLITYTKNNAQSGPIYLLSTSAPPGMILAIYAHVASASRFPDIWPVPGIVRYLENPTPANIEKADYYSAFLRRAVVEDFTRNPPTLVFVDTAKQKMFIGDYNFNFIHFFLQDPQFRQIWSHYRYAQRIGRFVAYKKN